MARGGSGEAFEVGGGLAGGFVGSREDFGGEWAVGGAAEFRVVVHEFAQASEGLGAGQHREAVGVELGGGGEVVEDRGCFGGFEEGEELSHGEVVAGGDVGEWDVAVEVVVQDGVAVQG